MVFNSFSATVHKDQTVMVLALVGRRENTMCMCFPFPPVAATMLKHAGNKQTNKITVCKCFNLLPVGTSIEQFILSILDSKLRVG